jgi:hypothetical protein
MPVTAFGLLGAMVIYAIIWRFCFAPRIAARKRAAATAQRMSHEARLKDLKEIDITALEVWLRRSK